MYYKQCIGAILSRKSATFPEWVRWTHHPDPDGKTHCMECLTLDGCWFSINNTPPCPHHPLCHCTLDPIPYAFVSENAVAHSDYSKFDPYLFNTNGAYPHGKEKLFQKWGYTVDDAKWLQTEMERQAREKYIAGEYELGKLDAYGQRINIIIKIPRRYNNYPAVFVSGWMVERTGKLKLNTPYGGK